MAYLPTLSQFLMVNVGKYMPYRILWEMKHLHISKSQLCCHNDGCMPRDWLDVLKMHTSEPPEVRIRMHFWGKI